MWISLLCYGTFFFFFPFQSPSRNLSTDLGRRLYTRKENGSSRSGFCLAWVAVVVAFPVMAPSFTERDRVEDSESFSLFGVDHTLWRRGLVADAVVAIGVCQVLLSEALHFGSLRWCDTRRDWFRFLGVIAAGRGLLGRVDSAAVEDEVREFGDIRRVFVVDFVFASIGSPSRSIPYCGIQSHWFRREVTTHICCSLHLSNGNIVHIKSTFKSKITTNL